jgi:superfamily I DNA/RNA helicase
MSKFQPSVYQQGIYDFIANGQGNAVVSAVAGSGKTTTLINALNLIPSELNVLFLAFNKSIAQELSERVPKSATNIEVKTLHAYGYFSLTKSHKSEIDNNKYRKLLKDILSYSENTDLEYLKKYNFKPSQINLVDNFLFEDSEKELIDDKISYFNRVQKLSDLGRLNLIDLKNQDNGVEQLRDLAIKHNVEIINGECYRAWLLINLGASYLDKADFTDMVFLPNHLNLQTQKYDIVFIDEAQDLNSCQRELMKKAIMPNTGRFIAVGDKHQCQPPDTLITLNNGKEVRIDEIKIGDKVVSYCSRKGKGFVGYHNKEYLSKRYSNFADEILQINKHEFDGNLISVKTLLSNNISKYTPNHKCMVKFINSDRMALYLMEKNGFFRIGIHYVNSNFGFGLVTRSRQEKCDRSWILNTYETREEAYADEQFYSYEYGIPQLRFIDNKTGTMTQDVIDSVWNRFDKQKQYENAIKLLNYFGRLYQYPIWYQKSNLHHSTTGLCEINACNLIDEIMLVPVFDKNKKVANKPLSATFETFKTNKVPYKGLVYSLKVSNREVYVADNILTHNSIYGFAGADSDSFDKLVNQPNTISLPLSVCYRCGSDIIEYVKNLMPTIEASPNAKKGLIDLNASYKKIVKGDMVICRNTMPLVSLCMKYLSQGIKAYVMGTDISASLITMIESCKRKTEEFSCENVFARIYAEKNKLVKNIMNKENCSEKEAEENTLVISFTDKISTLETLSSGCLTGDDLIDKLKMIFSDDSDGICLSTIHKSKGLEADRVFIIHEDLLPSKYAKKDWEKLQEKNLMYVAYTRAKSVLGFVTDFDAYSDHQSKENNIEITEGTFVGVVGEKHRTKLTIVMMKEMNTSLGDTTLFEMVDERGNIFSKFGDIPQRFLISNHAEVEVGSIVEFNATIKAHKEFRGVKTNVISTISK